MEIKILRENKNELEVELDSLSIAEILRVYLNKNDDVSLAAWKKEHPTKKPVLFVKTKKDDVKKVVEKAVLEITKDLEKVEEDFKKMN
jgi:DNA-directed RNA polymerase subunit L